MLFSSLKCTVFKKAKGKSTEIILSVWKIIIALYEHSEYRCSRIKDKNMETKDPFKKTDLCMYTCGTPRLRFFPIIQNRNGYGFDRRQIISNPFSETN